jgi:hypothetical protein
LIGVNFVVWFLGCCSGSTQDALLTAFLGPVEAMLLKLFSNGTPQPFSCQFFLCVVCSLSFLLQLQKLEKFLIFLLIQGSPFSMLAGVLFIEVTSQLQALRSEEFLWRESVESKVSRLVLLVEEAS